MSLQTRDFPDVESAVNDYLQHYSGAIWYVDTAEAVRAPYTADSDRLPLLLDPEFFRP